MYAEFKRSNQAPVEVNVAVMREFPIGRNVLITKMSTTTTTTIQHQHEQAGTFARHHRWIHL